MVATSGLLRRNVKTLRRTIINCPYCHFCCTRSPSMTFPTIHKLKKALQTCKGETEAKRASILARLAEKGPVSAEEEAWLDEAGNFVDEDIVIEKLESASDFGAVFKNLDTSQRRAYDQLESQIKKFRKPSAKRKAPEKHTEGHCDSGKAQAKKRKGAPTATSEQLGKLATMQQCVEVLDWYHVNGKNQSKTARHFNAKYLHLKIKQPLVSAWVKAEDKWREEYEKCGANGHKTKHICQSQHPEITDDEPRDSCGQKTQDL
ncbi:hypothetical protein EDD85DRAFT_990136 [Armillaria nabsnona]|nr:hypothetical protein EDD85DRAFT_990136 [Armillaria nabsnona]